jgi:hypothetical protein
VSGSVMTGIARTIQRPEGGNDRTIKLINRYEVRASSTRDYVSWRHFYYWHTFDTRLGGALRSASTRSIILNSGPLVRNCIGTLSKSFWVGNDVDLLHGCDFHWTRDFNPSGSLFQDPDIFPQGQTPTYFLQLASKSA